MKNLLIPFPTERTEAIKACLYDHTDEPYWSWSGKSLIEALTGTTPYYQASPDDTVLIDLDGLHEICGPHSVHAACEYTLAQLFAQFGNDGALSAVKQNFVLFSSALGVPAMRSRSGDAQTWAECHHFVSALVHDSFQGNAFLAPPLFDGAEKTSQLNFDEAVTRSVAIFMRISFTRSSTPKETLPMNYQLTAIAEQTLDRVPDNVKEIFFEFKDNTHVVGSYYENKEGGLKAKIELWSLPVEDFFVLPPTRGVLQLLNLYVLAKQEGLSLIDGFNGTFDDYVKMRRNEASPMVTKPKLAAMWHNPAGVVGMSQMYAFGKSSPSKPGGLFTNENSAMESPAAFDTCRDLPRIDPSMAPESIEVVRSKYLTILKHVANVKRWMALFMHLSKEEQAKKDELLAMLAEHTQIGSITMVMPFFAQALLSDEFLAAKQDGQYLGVVFSVEPQTTLGEVDVKCVFKLD